MPTSYILVIIMAFVFLALLAGLAFVLLRMVRQEIKLSQDQFLQLANQQMSAQQDKVSSELEIRKLAVENSVGGLKEQLDKYRQMMHEFEQDRATKYGNLQSEIKNVSQATLRLQDSTARLNNILGNVKLRGQWGERIAEDIIRYAGLLEGVNYIKQKKQATASTKPDYTFLLPDKHRINMDVKFPLDNYLQMVNSEDPEQKEAFLKEFVKNVKDRIKEIQNRDYINPAEDTLDFVLLFIPNEQVYGLIQEQVPGLLDTALEQKVVLCSPFTLYAMLSVIRQAYENFRYEKDIKKIILLIEQFLKLYDRFKDRFDGVGDSISKLERQYSDIRDKSFKQIDTKIRHIEDYKKGKKAVSHDHEGVIDLIPQDDDALSDS